MLRKRRDLDTAAWQKLRARLRAERQPCWICGAPIDYDADPRSRWSFSVDHVIPVSRGGDASLVQPAHHGCNSRRGNRLDTERSRASRRW